MCWNLEVWLAMYTKGLCIMISQKKTEEHPFADIFSEDETEKKFLLSKPVCFIIFGKPGAGKTTLAHQIAQMWKCVRIEALPLLEEMIAAETELGAMLQSMLLSGNSIPDELVTKLMLEKLNSLEVSHFGYIVTELPSLSEDAMTTLQQVELIKNLKLKPDVIINIKCPDYDLCQRISGQRQHCSTGYVYTRDQWDPEVIGSRRRKKKDTHKYGKTEEEGEEEEEQEEEEAFIAEMQMVAEILQHLVQRPEDCLENVENIIKLYKETILHCLEEVMAEHNPRYLIELDGNKPPEELFTTVVERLKFLNLRRAAVLTKLQSAEEEINDILENEELFRTLSTYKLIAPRYRWRRSRWGRMCPVALKEGNLFSGLPDFSVSFLGKMYCLSSEETLKNFLLNPRPYLLPPMPAPPCKVFIFGPQYSGKTTLSNLIAEYYKGKVVDYTTLVQPRFDAAREALIENTIAEATEAAIKVVKENLLIELQTKRQAEIKLREIEKELEKKENGVLPEDAALPSSVNEEGYTQESQTNVLLEDTEEAKRKSENVLDNLPSNIDKDDEKEITETSTSQGYSQDFTYSQNLDLDEEYSIEEVTANHPAVISMLEESLKTTKDMNFEHPYEKHAEILEEILKEVMEENKNRFSGAPKNGGWILDNCPVIKDLWMTLIDKGILPDMVILLSDTENNGKCLFNRIYLKHKSEIDSKILERLLDELQKKKQEEAAERKAKEEELRVEEEKQRLLDAINKKAKEAEEIYNDPDEELEGEDYDVREEPEVPEDKRESLLPEEPEMPDTERKLVSESSEDTTTETEITKESREIMDSEELSETVVLPEFPEDAYPDVPEMEPFIEQINSFSAFWKLLEPAINETAIHILNLEVSGKTPEELLQKVVDTMEKPFQHNAWELTVEDYDEETEDYQAEAEVDEELEEEEEEEEESEERIKEKRRHLGDTKHFCPVVLKENFILQPCNIEEAAKYREKIYYFSSPEAKEKFLEHPEDYVAHEEPLKAPPPRICLLGPHGSGKTVCGRQLAEKFGIFHIQFDEVLQEKLLLKTERKFGPEYEEDSEEEQVTKQELEELAVQANVKIEDENAKKQPPEVQLTEEEEAIKTSLVESEPLPPEILEVILSEWWFKEPIRSTGFILDGFPRYPEEALFLGERGFFPDAAVFIQVDDQDIFDRLLPSKVEKWKQKQKKKLERKKLIKDMKTKIRDDMIAKRRAELIAEKEKRKRAEGGVKEDEEVSEEEPEDEEDEIENILEEEFPKDEEEMSEEDEEQEMDAVERLRSELGEKFETDMNNLQMIQDEFEKFLVPMIHVNGARKIHIVQYILNTKLKPLVENRESIFEKCYPISTQLAQKMLTFTYKYISSFGYWDPVKLYEGEIFKPVENSENPTYPVIHRQYIYFLSSKETKDKFMKNPIKYIRQPKPKLTVPVRIIIVGPPKSGKTTVAKKLAGDYGLKRLSAGDALRTILNNHAETELGLMLNWHLHKGMVAPDELTVQALDLALMDSVCNTSGVVIDGYPVTAYQMNLLETRSIIPMIIFELDVPSKEIFKRLFLEKKNQPNLPYPLHNSAQIIAVKNAKYRKNIGAIRQYYQEQHQNWYVIDGFHSKWWVWNEVTKSIKMVNKHMQTYLERIKEGKAAHIDKLCITPQELISRLGEFGQFCPVCLAESNELFDCSVTNSLEFAAEFRGHYYKMSSQENLNKFLENPELYVPPLAPHPLPPANMIPKRLTPSELKSQFPKSAELQGYCPVTYQDGKQRYEALVPGNINYAVEYRGRIYICESKEKLEKFLRFPLKYWDQKLPHKLPPLKEPINLTSLPLPGYLEQGTASSLIKAMNAAGCLKPKFPFLSVRRSALLYIAFHLKAFNPKGSEYTRKKYKKKMEQFMERCELITYLGAKMTRQYKEPQFRAIDFDHKLQTFLSLKNIDPVSG
ncbi:adenylate kinase 9 isoform X3 [Sciurus carolinensis]|uniref:adenylate kinase 9 isoform X3 n=1 Tax=Sciurus carolinensis TaxID=30640 RepID=UPI001FB3F803|nr:adenylate kinase 9 isoform X3 [Sciurus carolinensis]